MSCKIGDEDHSHSYHFWLSDRREEAKQRHPTSQPDLLQFPRSLQDHFHSLHILLLGGMRCISLVNDGCYTAYGIGFTYVQLANLCGDLVTEDQCWDYLATHVAPLTISQKDLGLQVPPVEAGVMQHFFEEVATRASSIARHKVSTKELFHAVTIII